ncbi:MAG: hypothetical protein H6607_09170 [Flavobacteriales bacterium]|nr:hypothetical protein [Flavobacteriales bacterium]
MCNGSYSKYDSRGSNIIEQLYQEALSEDDELKKLNSTLENLDKNISKTLSSANEYNGFFARYWSAAIVSIKQISDSSISQKTNLFIQKKKNEHEKSETDLQTKQSILEKQKTEHEQKFLALKIHISQQQLEKYKKENRPKPEDFDQLLNEIQNADKAIQQKLKALNSAF